MPARQRIVCGCGIRVKTWELELCTCEPEALCAHVHGIEAATCGPSAWKSAQHNEQQATTPEARCAENWAARLVFQNFEPCLHCRSFWNPFMCKICDHAAKVRGVDLDSRPVFSST